MSKSYVPGYIQEHTPLNAVTATTTSNAIPCAGAKKITAVFTRANHSSGSSAFKLQGSIDGTNFFDLELYAHDGSKTRAITVTLSADGSEMHSADIEHTGLAEVRAVVTETTDGTHSAKLLITT